MEIERRKSDIKDVWVEGEEEKYLQEGDIVLLHNWGIHNGTQVIGVATVTYNVVFHGWDFDMIAGQEIEDNYDKWRQKPKIIGNIFDGLTDLKYKKYVASTDDCFNSHSWNILIKENKIENDINYKRKLIIQKQKLINDAMEETKGLMAINELTIKECKKDIDDLQREKITMDKNRNDSKSA